MKSCKKITNGAGARRPRLLKQSRSRDNESNHKPTQGNSPQLGKVVWSVEKTAVHSEPATQSSRMPLSKLTGLESGTSALFRRGYNSRSVLLPCLVVLVVRQLPDGSQTIETLTPISPIAARSKSAPLHKQLSIQRYGCALGTDGFCPGI